ncbi:TPA: hypothetical protein N0F65_006645 [Lagenidium giganteum]|uniref:MULE transposase domain-containing protein n=1 Tax=Lagenidium giganteum TaxID=4803 RepID=A0AAV2ZE63_9STRA|nr:TPA: hypothetical protein N0F65_006645 [Lagenidium giganteum]
MVHDRGHDLYVPCMYFLADGQTVVCDFAQGMMNAIRDELPNTGIVGCLFHWKQALRRKMASLGISRQHISVAMAPGNMGLLTVAKASVVQS